MGLHTLGHDEATQRARSLGSGPKRVGNLVLEQGLWSLLREKALSRQRWRAPRTWRPICGDGAAGARVTVCGEPETAPALSFPLLSARGCSAGTPLHAALRDPSRSQTATRFGAEPPALCASAFLVTHLNSSVWAGRPEQARS